MNKTALVTGANGFLGLNLCEALIKRGYTVRGMVRRKEVLPSIEETGAIPALVSLADREAIAQALEGVDVIVNVAGKASDWGDYKSFVLPNIDAVRNLIEVGMDKGVSRFVQISSCAIHGFGNHINTTEEGPYFPSPFPYCQTKKLGEELAFSYYKDHSFPVTAIRPCNIYGEKDNTTIGQMAPVLETRQVPYVSGGKYLTCPVYVGNLIDAIIAAMEKDEAVGEAFLISDGLEINWKQWTQKLCAALGVKDHWLSLPGGLSRLAGSVTEGLFKLFGSKTPPPITRYRTQQVSSNYHFSIEKAQRILGWTPAVGLDEAVERTIRWYQSTKSK